MDRHLAAHDERTQTTVSPTSIIPAPYTHRHTPHHTQTHSRHSTALCTQRHTQTSHHTHSMPPTPHSAALQGQAQDIGHVCVLSRFSPV